MARRGLSGAVAAALLVLVSVAAALLLYLWAGSVAAGGGQRPHALPALKIDAVEPVRGAGGRCVYFRVYVRNVGTATTVIDGNASGYVEGLEGAVAAASAPLRERRLAPGDSASFSLVPLWAVNRPGRVRVVASGGVEASASVRGCGVSPIGTVLLLPAVDGASASRRLPGGVVVGARVEYVTASGGETLYRVWYNVSLPAGVTLTYLRAEILTVDGVHPVWAGNPVVEYTSTVSGPNYVADYWEPVRESEFPVTVVVSVEYSYS